MGIRLYPATGNTESLERLACVPPGTADALTKFRSKHGLGDNGIDFFDRERRYAAYHDELSHFENLRIYDRFCVFGWGKFSGFGVHRTGECGGETSDRYDMAKLLLGNGICPDVDKLDEMIALCEGLRWS